MYIESVWSSSNLSAQTPLASFAPQRCSCCFNFSEFLNVDTQYTRYTIYTLYNILAVECSMVIREWTRLRCSLPKYKALPQIRQAVKLLVHEYIRVQVFAYIYSYSCIWVIICWDPKGFTVGAVHSDKSWKPTRSTWISSLGFRLDRSSCETNLLHILRRQTVFT